MASIAIGATVGGDVGTASALDGQRFNQQLHPDMVRSILAEAPAFAEENGLSLEEAQWRLLLQAMRLQDADFNPAISIDQIGGSEGLPDDALARDFFQRHSQYEIDGKHVDIFKPALPGDSAANAWALYEFLDKHPNAELAFYNAQVAGFGQREIDLTPEQQAKMLAGWANQDVLKNYYVSDVLKASDNAFYKFYGQIALAGISGGMFAGAPLLVGASHSGKVASLAEFILTSRVGTGATSGLVNAGSQLIQDGSVDWAKVGISAATGGLSVGGKLPWNMAVGAIGGATQAELDNYRYGSSQNIFEKAIISSIPAGLGYKSGDKTSSMFQTTYPDSLTPIIIGNIQNSITNEASSSIIKIISNNQIQAEARDD